MRKTLYTVAFFLLVSLICSVMNVVNTPAATEPFDRTKAQSNNASRLDLMLTQYSNKTPKSYSFNQKNQLENKVRNLIKKYDQKIYRLERKPQTYDIRTRLTSARNTRKNLQFRLTDLTTAHEGNWTRVERMTQQTLKDIQKRY